ncbi:MAG TPA: Mut7-C RNAse domain-containing protein [Chthoniobacterales bacterium]|nr:Mut7-C RNAse domain-containing protein [Chthoniobacterales bacterium]
MFAQEAGAFSITFRFSPELWFFMPKPLRAQRITRVLHEKTSIKDAIEACGVPHPEINLIRCNGESVGFEHQLSGPARVEVFGFDSVPEPRLQQRRLTRFVADGHLGTLTRDLRLLGFDVWYAPNAADDQLVRIAAAEERALLTRDRRLLMHKTVRHGYCPRSLDPEEQVIEVLQRFDLSELLRPYTRCSGCGGMLERVDKAQVLDQLEPLTRLYYEDFRRCTHCGKIYWSGSHFAKLEARLEKIRARLSRPLA